jgi:hypothetical protein
MGRQLKRVTTSCWPSGEGRQSIGSCEGLILLSNSSSDWSQLSTHQPVFWPKASLPLPEDTSIHTGLSCLLPSHESSSHPQDFVSSRQLCYHHSSSPWILTYSISVRAVQRLGTSTTRMLSIHSSLFLPVPNPPSSLVS